MVAPKKSLRPKSREQVDVENQMQQFGNLEFRADMDEQLRWNPLARLGFEPDQSVVGRPRYNSPDIYEGIRYPYYAEQEYIDETLPGAASGAEYRDIAGRVKPGSVVVNSNTAKNPVWSHEYTHGGIEKVVEYLNEDREFFTEKYGEDTVKLLDEIQTDRDRSKGPDEKLTEMLDDVSKDAEVDIHGHLIPAAGTALGGMDSTRTAVEDVSSRTSLQEYLKKGRVSDNLSGKASFEASFPGYSGIFKAAEDMLEKQGEPLPSEKRGWWERKTRQWLSGGGLFNEGFAQGGVVDMNNQMEMLFDEGGIADDGMRRDPVSGNEIPPGSMAEEVRDDIPAQLSEGEYVVPADVVRFFGVKYFEDLRTEAKMGLSNMEANGRIGGEPVGPSGMEVGPSGMEENPLTPEEMAVLEQMGMAVGGFVPEQEPPQAVGNSVQGFAPGGDVQPTTNYGGTSAGLPSWAAIPGASYMPQEWQEENLPSTTSYKPVQTITTADSTPTTTTTTDTATDAVTATTGKEACEKMGMMFDEATQQCVLKQGSSTSDDPTVTPTTGKFKFEKPDVDYFNMSDEDLAKVGLETSNKIEDTMIKAGATKLLGGAGLAGFGFFDSIRQGSTIAEVRSAALVAAAKGNTALADTLNARAKELVGKSSLLVQGADYFGALTGMNDFAQQIAAFTPINFKIDKELFGDNEAAYQRAVMASVTPKDDGLGKTAETRAAQKILSNKNSFEELSKTDRPETWEGQTKEVGGIKVKQFQPAKTAAEIQKSKNDDKDSPEQKAAKNKAKAEAAASRLGVNLATGGRYKGGLMKKRKKK